MVIEMKMNNFEKLCGNLYRRKGCDKSQCNATNYLCAYKQVSRYVNGDINKLKELRAETNASDNSIFLASITASFSLLISALTLLVTMCFALMDDTKKVEYIVFVTIIMVGFSVYILYRLERNKAISKWREYVKEAIETVAKEI